MSSTTAKNTEEDNPTIMLRLSKDLRPFHYDVHWKSDIYQPTRDGFTANATAMIHLRCHSPSAVISLNYRHLVFDSFSFVVVNRSDNSVIPIDIICADRDDEAYNITMVRRLAVGDEVVLTMKYTVYIQEGPTADNNPNYSPSNIGIFTGQYSTGNDTRYALFTQMQTTEARRTFPCLDDPDVKATFTISIDRETQLRTLSNTPINYTYSVNRSSNWVTDVFQTTKPMSTYLVAFVISDYTNVTVYGGCNNVTISLWAPDDFVRAGYLDYAASVAAAAVNFYEDYFDYVYSWPKLDLASIPGKDFGGMANWALMFFQSNYLLFDESLSDSEDQVTVASFVSRLIAHSWLGNTVTIKWWDDVWLTEGMSKYLQYLGIQSAHPSWDIEQLFLTEVFYSGAMWLDDYGYTPAVYKSTFKTFADLDKQFDDFTISKGASMIRMLSNLIGEDSFQMALQQCIIDYEYGNIDHNDLFAEMTKACNDSGDGLDFNVTDVLLTWIVQAQYPLVRAIASRGQNGSSTHMLNLTQTIYFVLTNHTADDLEPSPYGNLWEIPIIYITSHNPNPVRVWMHKDKQIVITLQQPLNAGDWVLVNHNLYGFYRVTYDDANLMALVAQLKSDHTKIPINNRGQLIDDGFALSINGDMSQVTCLQLTEYLANETEYLPWKQFKDNVAFILWRLTDNVQLYTRIQNYILSRLRTNYNILGWENTSNDNITTVLLRRLILEMACSTDFDQFVTKATTRFQLWKANGFNNTLITPDQRFAVYCAVAARGNYDDWKLMASRYQATLSHFSSESDRLVRALTCTRNVTTITSLLQSIQNQQVNIVAQQDQIKVLSYISQSLYGYNATWDHLVKYGSSAFRRVDILSYLSLTIATPTEAAKFTSYVTQFPAQNKDETEKFAYFWYIIQVNIKWRQINEQGIGDWLTTLGF